jgi:hypothetical protein
MAVDEAFFKKIVTDRPPYDISLISDFNSLIAISQMKNKPVYELTADDLRQGANVYGAALETMTGNVERFKNVFEDMAEKVAGLTS